VSADPKIRLLDYYAGATVVTPNHHEAEVARHMGVLTDGGGHRGRRPQMGSSLSIP
jgi:hypothetical protein